MRSRWGGERWRLWHGLTALSAVFCIAAMLGTMRADAAVYWDNGTSLAAANADGSGLQPRYLRSLSIPQGGASPFCGLAVSQSHLYWVGAFGIGRVNFEGAPTPATIVSGLQPPCGIAVDATRVYWASQGAIGSANLDGSDAKSQLISGLEQPCGLAVLSDRVYWADRRGIGRARLDGSQPEPGFISSPVSRCTLVTDGWHLFWGTGTGIARANLSGANLDDDFVAGLSGTENLATDGSYLYWTDRPPGITGVAIARARVDGSDVNRSWIVPGQWSMHGLAVDARPTPPPLPLPSQPVRIGDVKYNERSGRATVFVYVPESGDLAVVSPKIGWRVRTGPASQWGHGTMIWRLKIWPGGGAAGKRIRALLRKRGRAPLSLRISFAEAGQLPFLVSERIVLRKIKPQRVPGGPGSDHAASVKIRCRCARWSSPTPTSAPGPAAICCERSFSSSGWRRGWRGSTS